MAIVNTKTGFLGGFTLLEMLIALSIFSVVVTVGSGALVTLQATQSHAINLQNAHDNIRYTLGTISLEILAGDNYCFGSSCKSGGSPVSFCSWAGSGCESFTFRQSLTKDTIDYRLNIVDGKGRVERQINGEGFIPMTDPDRTVTKLIFYTTGLIGFPQRVTIVIEVKAGDLNRPGGESRIRMQTAVTKRNITF